MKIYNLNTNYHTNKTNITVPSFRHNAMETIKHTNIGMAPNGIIGKVRVRKSNGQECFLNVLKNAVINGEETYQLQERFGKVVGEINIKIKKLSNDMGYGSNNPSHVFVETLRNYSKKGTDYTRTGLEEYKDIGTRLIQIAQRRSDESFCQGNIELKSKEGAKPFYKKLGFEFVPMPYGSENSNKMYLPPHAKEALSKIQGGL